MEWKSIEAIVKSINKDKLEAVALMGSYALGAQKEFSDIDLVLFTNQARPIDIQIMDSKLVVISTINDQALTAIFTQPESTSELYPLMEAKDRKMIELTNERIKEEIEIGADS